MLGLTGCTGTPGSAAPTSTASPSLADAVPAAPRGDVVGAGLVVDASDGATLCLGVVMESAPPQCAGTPIQDWSWDGVENYDSWGEAKWGGYLVTGHYDGSTFRLTTPPATLALYDPLPVPDPTGGKTGTTSAARLQAVQHQVQEEMPGVQAVYADRGYLWVDVAWDDGTLQDAADAAFGRDVVVVRSVLRELD